MRITCPLRRRSLVSLPPLPTVGELLKIYQIRAAKQLSQNFLLDQKLCRKLVQCGGPLTDSFVLEVGPGPGSLTRAILQNDPKKLVLIEKDRRFLPILNDLKNAFEAPLFDHSGHLRHGAYKDGVDATRLTTAGRPSDERIKIIRGDVLTQRVEGLFPSEAVFPWDHDSDPPVNVVGNLPFAISTPLLIKWLEDMSEKRGIFSYGRVGLTLTFQKEVAERMVATITNVQRCRLSVMCQLYAHVKKCFIIPGRAFVPPPDVDVAVVTVHPKRINDVPQLNFRMVEKLVRNVFQFRQKRIERCLERLFPPDLSVILCHRMLQSTGISADTRPYFVSNEEICLLCLAYKEILTEVPAIFGYQHDEPAHLRVPKENDIYRAYKLVHGGDLWKLGFDVVEQSGVEAERFDHYSTGRNDHVNVGNV